jgi:hypothetical protein
MMPPAPNSSRTRKWTWLALALVLVLVVAGTVILIVTRKDSVPGTASVSTELYLESSDSAGVSPFTSTVAAPLPTPAQPLPQPSVSPPIRPTTTPAPTPTQQSQQPPAQPQPAPQQPSVLPISGATPGLYGGTQDQASCDRNQMATFLMSNPDKANAWVAALNSDPSLRWSGGNQLAASQIPQYLNEMTPIRLLADTRVTNNGYADGRPTPFQSVLQAGTAVFVDQYGVPRARCACGNPLLRSVPLTSPPVNVGTPWTGYGNSVTIIQSTTIINNYTIINITNGVPFPQPSGGGNLPYPGQPTTVTATATATVTEAPVTVTAPPVTVTAPGPTGGPITPPYQTPTLTTSQQPPGTGTGPLTVPPTVALGTGDVQATLLWSNGSDLDLHVTDPSGTDIYYSNRTSSTGGQLDYDNIPGCNSAPDTHVENIFWPAGGAPPGPYKVYVVDFAECGTSSSFELKVTVGGQVVYNQPGTLTGSGQQSTPYEFTR